MRTVTRSSDRSERGAVLIWVALMMVMLLGFGVIVIDVGALYKERRELQNGADAAALAVAKDCAEGDCLDEWTTATYYASRNAEDEVSGVAMVCGVGTVLDVCPEPPDADIEGASGWVFVETLSSPNVDFVLAPVLDIALQEGEVSATAVAAWGPLGRANTLALTFSQCEYEAAGGNLETGDFPSGEVFIYFHGDTDLAGTCGAGPSGGDLPGGFGWLDETDCEAEIDEDSIVGDDPGASAPSACRDLLEDLFESGEVTILPIYDDTNGLTGNNGTYHIAGFVGFKVLGYRFPGETNPSGFMCPEGQGASATCIWGEFQEVTEGGNGEFGDNDFGATLIKMVG